jgi:putative ABC transport system permease protein
MKFALRYRLRAYWARVRTLLRRGQAERELDDELAFHLEMQTEQNVDAGMSRTEARRKALLLFGGVERHKEAVRDRRWLRWAEDLWSDVRYAGRGLGRSPAFTVVALLTLALGIGANSGLFGLVNAMFFRTPPGVSENARLARIEQRGDIDEVSYAEYREVARDSRSFDGIAASWSTELDLVSGGEPLRVKSAFVSSNYFAVLGTRFVQGRGFHLDDEGAARPRDLVAILGHGLWQSRFHADPDIVGSAININGVSFTVVGVTTEGFSGTEFEDPAELWLPAAQLPIALPTYADKLDDRGFDAFALLGQLRDGVSVAAAEAELAPISKRIDALSPDRNEPWHDPFVLGVDPLRGWYPFAASAETVLLTSFASLVTGLVLLIACANLANLMLARAVARRREIGIRLSLGVTRRRLIRLLLTEAFLLALLGGSLGLFASFWIADLFQSRLLAGVTGLVGTLDLSPDLMTIVFTGVLTLCTALLFGLVPALRASRRDLSAVIKGDSPAWLRRTRLQSSLVVAQLALSLVLLLTGGLFLRKLQMMLTVNLGYDTENVLSLSLDLGSRGYGDGDKTRFYQELRERTAGLPGIESATAPTSAPFARYGGRLMTNLIPSETPPLDGGDSHALSQALEAYAGPDFFRTLGIPVLQGRGIDERDVRTNAPVVVVSAALAQRYWPNQDALGKTLVKGSRRDTLFVVVGVVANVRWRDVAAPPELHVYRPASRVNILSEHLLLRTTGDAAALSSAVRAQIRQMDPTLPVFNLRTLASAVDQQIRFQRVLTTAIAVLSGLALLLASIGLYGVIAFSVKGRTREIAMRMALGARAGAVLALFLRDGLRFTLIGTLAGGLLAILAGKLIAAAVTGVRPYDPIVLMVVASILALVALLSTLLPARRATRIDPMAALRSD